MCETPSDFSLLLSNEHSLMIHFFKQEEFLSHCWLRSGGFAKPIYLTFPSVIHKECIDCFGEGM